MSTFEMLCYIIAVACIVLVIDTAGAIEIGVVTGSIGFIRCIIFLAVAGGSIFVGRRYA